MYKSSVSSHQLEVCVYFSLFFFLLNFTPTPVLILSACLSMRHLSFCVSYHGQTKANRSKPGLSFVTLDVSVLVYTIQLHSSLKAAKLKVKNLSQTTFRLSPVNYCVPRSYITLTHSLFLLSLSQSAHYFKIIIRINQLSVSANNGLYYKHIMVVNDKSRVISK